MFCLTAVGIFKWCYSQSFKQKATTISTTLLKMPAEIPLDHDQQSRKNTNTVNASLSSLIHIAILDQLF